MITIFKKFQLNETMISHDISELHNGNYLNLERTINGDLKISLTDEGREKVEEDGISEETFFDYFEDITSNSSLLYITDISEIGAMMNAPAIVIGYYCDDDGNYVDINNEDYSEIFYYTNYIIRDFTEDLKTDEYVIFKSSGILTPEELEEFEDSKLTPQENELKKASKKFNL